MNKCLPLLSILLCAAGPAVHAAAPASASAAAVNPLTGQPLAFEATQRRLEQMRLETQLLEEEAKQAAIRSNMTLAPIRRSHEERRLQAEMFGPGPGVGSPAATARSPGPVPAARMASQPARAQAPNVQSPVAPAASTLPPPAGAPSMPQGPHVLAILRNGDHRRAIVQAGATTATVAEGEEWMGRRIGPITDGSVTIDGAVIELPRNPAVIAAIDRRPPPGQPQGASASTVAPAARTIVAAPAAPSPVFPPLPPLPTLPAIGPVDPRNPLSAIGPQPAFGTAMPPRPSVPAAIPPPVPGAASMADRMP